jgi:hypothetical protein
MESLTSLRARGAATVSLNFSTFSGLPARLGGRTLARLGGLAFQTSTLEVFNNKFLPEWTPRYLAVRHWLDLPDVLWAIVVAEGADRALYNALARSWRRLRTRYRAAFALPATSPVTSPAMSPATSRVSGERA